jgi:hypothetical protein
MIAMRMMQPSAHEVIDVIAMGHDFVSTRRPMLVRAARLRRALHGIGGVDCHGVLVDMILVRMMKVAVVEIIDVALMADRRMPAVGTMLVGVVGVMLLGAGGHNIFSFFLCGPSRTGLCRLSAACSMALRDADLAAGGNDDSSDVKGRACAATARSAHERAQSSTDGHHAEAPASQLGRGELRALTGSHGRRFRDCRMTDSDPTAA